MNGCGIIRKLPKQSMTGWCDVTRHNVEGFSHVKIMLRTNIT